MKELVCQHDGCSCGGVADKSFGHPIVYRCIPDSWLVQDCPLRQRSTAFDTHCCCAQFISPAECSSTLAWDSQESMCSWFMVVLLSKQCSCGMLC